MVIRQTRYWCTAHHTHTDLGSFSVLDTVPLAYLLLLRNKIAHGSFHHTSHNKEWVVHEAVLGVSTNE